MTIQQMLLGGAGESGYNLTRSLRFRASASAYLNRTPSASNRNTWTWSGWVKRGKLGAQQTIFASYPSGSAYAYITFNSSDQLRYASTSTGGNLITTRVFRDPSAWYHIVIAYDDTQATASNRLKFYINGVQETAFGTATYPDLNFNGYINGAFVHNVARFPDGTEYFDGYLAEVNFIDGQALTPSSFGSTNALTGVWQPAPYTGTYGTNGFYLPFTDNSTAAALGTDFSGNGNTWTVNNISVTAGVTYDSMTDVPTLTSATAANYAVLNPLQRQDAGYTTAITNGNLAVAITYSSGANMVTVPSTIKTSSSGKWYWEINITSTMGVGGATGVGIITPDSFVPSTNPPTDNYLYIQSGNKSTNGTSTSYGATFTNGDVIGVALDVDAGTLEFYKNNVSQGVAFTGLATTSYYAVVTSNATGTRSYAINFGQRPFAYTPPTGFVALNAFNLPAATIVKGNTVMDATLWSGNSSTQSITNAATFRPDFVWIKCRSTGFSHVLQDSIRGTNVFSSSNTTGAETTDTTVLTAFNSNGFSLGSSAAVNNSGNTYIGWQWQAGQGATSSNTNGTITSTVSVNASAGFSVVTYTGNGASGATVGHGLGVAAKFVTVRGRSAGTAGQDWLTWHSAIAGSQYLVLNGTSAVQSSAAAWNNVIPSSSVITLGNSGAVNASANTYVAYCWSEIDGFSKFGSYTGNGSADGPFVYTGFRPKFVLFKMSSAASSWFIRDTERDTYNASTKSLFPNLSDAENPSGAALDILSNGFKLRNTTSGVNGSGETIIYAAYAENPFKHSLAR